jgi:DNA-binding NtrC family response regulator
MFLGLLTEILLRRGYRVLTASDGEQAIAQSQLHDDSLDLLLSDMVMPGMSGVELAKRLRAQHPRLRVLLMSGYTEEALQLRNAKARGFAFLQKPFQTDALLRRVRRLLDDDSSQDAAEPLSDPPHS